MSAEWKPGDVGLVPFPGDVGLVPFSDEAAVGFRVSGGWVTKWNLSPLAYADVRPLVVIDPENREQVERLDALIDAGLCGKDTPKWSGPADVLQAALREFANPTPPKPDEPTGLGAVVEDADGAKWILVYDEMGDVRLWAPLGAVATQTKWREWAEINVARVLSEGMPS